MREIIKEPNEILHKKCELVTDFEEAKKISVELLITIKSLTKWWNRFLGFAANGIGYSKRIIVLRRDKSQYEFFTNPVFLEKRFPFPYIENCYCLNLREFYLVKRYLWARVKYRDLQGVWREKVFKGFSGIYQEIDHLNGVMVSEIGVRIL